MKTWRCGHPRTFANTALHTDTPRCLLCRRALERAASRRYRERHREESVAA